MAKARIDLRKSAHDRFPCGCIVCGSPLIGFEMKDPTEPTVYRFQCGTSIRIGGGVRVPVKHGSCCDTLEKHLDLIEIVNVPL